MSDRDTEAGYWFARMRASDPDQDQAAFDEWCADPENAATYAAFKENWLLTGGIPPEQIGTLGEEPTAAAPNRARWALAAALILALSIGFTWVSLSNRDAAPIIAGNESGEIILEDGTRALLMDGASLKPDFSATERRVRLTGGRARFTVAHDAARPFRVEAAGSETTALGTIFEVDLTGTRPVIHLIQGSVEVHAKAKPQAPLRLRPGQRAEVADDTPRLIGTGETDAPLTMTSPIDEPAPTSFLVAERLPLGAVIDRANRVNATQIRVENPSLANRLVSGRFDVADAGALARKLAAALDLSVEIRADGFLLTPKINH
ncbi:FecR family protein [Sphingopyxis witflariensis]|uniref:FecR family protein n=1 Tax=Sphingopyxis witflariensis TaxID=173675 RepID=UPI001303991C|nr:FecR domain-containing protein [Sphingopyxis witflariensis]